MDTRLKGDITELQCITKFTQLGFYVSIPFGGHARYDFLVDFGDKILRFQTKTCSFKKGCITIDGRTCHFKQGEHTHSTYSSNEIDFFVTFYDMNCYVIPVSECKTGKYLRIDKTNNNQTKNVCYAQDYLVEKVFSDKIANIN